MNQQKLLEVVGWPFKKRSSTLILFYAILIASAIVATRYINVSTLTATSIRPAIPESQDSSIRQATPASQDSSVRQETPASQDLPVRQANPASKDSPTITPKKTQFPLECVGRNYIQTCPTDYPATYEENTASNRTTCPEYFQWIHADLQPWKIKGITREMVEAARDLAYFRLVVVDGKPFLERYRGAYQTRDIFTIWGILQLLRLYPGKLPDLDIMFECGDKPVIKKENYTDSNFANAPPMFHYCGDDTTLDIAFPDWSFWGWPEINIKPWHVLKKELKEGTRRVKWAYRLPHAYWKGNPYMGDRMNLLECNSTKWKAAIVAQDWVEESKLGFKRSNIADQCNHRYKIYIEGIAWSVSEKYVLACDSMTLLVMPQFYEFFTRSLQPLKHYWPIIPNDLCQSIKFAVDWGNEHSQRAQQIGKAGSKFIQHDLQMKYVYDYMFHLLNEYGKLLRYKPSVPPGAMEVCSETLACPIEGLDRQFKVESMVKGPSKMSPCMMSPPKDAETVKAYIEQQESIIKNVDMLMARGDPGVDI